MTTIELTSRIIETLIAEIPIQMDGDEQGVREEMSALIYDQVERYYKQIVEKGADRLTEMKDEQDDRRISTHGSMTQEGIKVGMLLKHTSWRKYYKVLLIDVMFDNTQLVVMEEQFVQRPQIIAYTKAYIAEKFLPYNGEDF